MNSYGEQALEARVCAAFAAMPACELKRALGELVVAWAYHLQHFHCDKSQADGAPCQDVEPDCVSCLGLTEALQRWSRAAAVKIQAEALKQRAAPFRTA